MSTGTLERKGPSVDDLSPEAKAQPGIEMKRAGGSGIVEADDTTGLVTAIVSVTGLKDEVDDIILPGAYAETLKKRTPKGVWSHDWNLWTARTETVEEILPGDSRLPALTRAGKTWPKEAGVLLVKARFNLETQQGREAFSNVKFFADECEWSIGYTVLPGKSMKDAQGVRMIKQIELFEFSPVLFGAMPLAGTLAVKTRQQALVEGKTAATAVAAEDDEDVELDEHETGMIALMGDDVSAFIDPTDEEDIDTLAAGEGEAKGSGASLNKSPRKNWVENTGELPRYIREVARSISEKRGVPLDEAIPIAIGVIRNWAEGKGDVKADTKAKAAKALAAWEALKAKAAAKRAAKASKGIHPLLEEWTPTADGGTLAPVSTTPAGDLQPSLKAYPYLAGSEEERRNAIEKAVTERLYALGREALASLPKDERERAEAGQAEVSGRGYNGYVSIDGTFADRIIATLIDWHTEPSQRTTYEMTYVIDDNLNVSLGEPQKRELVVTVDVAAAEQDFRENAGTAEYGAYVDMAGKAIESLREVKAGRVLSATNETRLRAAVENLVAVLRAAGVVIGTDPDGDGDGTTDPETTAPSTTTTGGDPVEAKTIHLNPAEFAATALSLEAAVHAHKA